jgi:glycosyltransferase involved in cell wall biosynthesis
MSEKKIKALFWPGWWYPNRRNPIEAIFVAKHAEAVSRFCDVYLLFVYADPQLEGRTYEPDYGEENGVYCLRMYHKPSPKIPILGKIIDFFKYVKAANMGLDFLINKFGAPNVVHVNVNPPVGLIYLLLTRLKGIPFIHTEHWTGYLKSSGKYRGFFRKLFTRIFISRASVIAPVSKDLQQAMINHKLTGRYQVIPNVADTDLFVPGGDNKTKTRQRFLHVSNFRPVKNIDGMIKVMGVLSKERDDFELYIVGDGKTRSFCEQLASQLGIKDKHVFFAGKMDVAGVAAQMKDADYFLLFSDFENSPCVIVEAFCAGLPVITTDVGGISEHVSEENGVLFEPRNEKMLVGILRDVLDNPTKFNREKIRDYAVNNFSYHVIGEKFYKLYQQMLTD